MSYQKSAQYYDLLYGWKDYAKEAAQLTDLLTQHGVKPGASILDVACGTGAHAAHLANTYQITGVDLEPEMIAIAKNRVNGSFEIGDMRTFNLETKFDAVLCLFSSIGYMQTDADLNQAVSNMTRHLKPNAPLMIEPWFGPDDFHHGHVSHLFREAEGIKIERMGYSTVENGVAVMEMHHLVGVANQGIHHFTETHRMPLYTDAQYRQAFTRARLTVERIDSLLTGRGLYIGK